MLLTKLPASINSLDEAKAYLRTLWKNGEAYHPEDDATDCLRKIATHDEAVHMNKLMNQVYSFDGFDPCEFLLDLHAITELKSNKKQFTVKDKTGRGYTGHRVTAIGVRELDKWNDDLTDWLEKCDVDDEFSTNKWTIVCTRD